MPEFDLINRIARVFGTSARPGDPGCVLGIGDDAALVELEDGWQLAVCVDTLVEGVHFGPDATAGAVGHKSLAVNLSDLAAMGADPAWFLLALTLPGDDPDWVDAFAGGMAGLAGDTGIVLAGGDTTSGPLGITVTAAGRVPRGQALTRAGAKPGDLVYVSGVTGRAALALRALQAGETPDREALAALHTPTPRLALGRALRGIASACIDISDGLAADLGHILECSDVGACLEVERLPSASCFDEMPNESRWSLQLGGGDDYELCFTVAADQAPTLDALQERLGILLTRIGSIRREPGLTVLRRNGKVFDPGIEGYQHFSPSAGGA
ncbi:MAG: thiamine-phosphate kinase [Gammaproteobacteria bacterium]|nr:thiamine-phosphate kinase [Gammaproteobacteria bacterium]NNJ80253.1 thiamine-phosphate kinase [Xanthomonadales bacterium]